MNAGLTLIGGAGLGAGLMYLLDPDLGRRRRAVVGDQVAHAVNELGDAVNVAARDLNNRAHGLAAETAALLRRESVPDAVLAERVRAKLGRVASHPRAIEVHVDQGRVVLSGPVLAREVEYVISAAAAVRGVTGVENRLEVHQQPGGVPGLQGGRSRTGERVELMQENWSPATRLLVGTAGAALLALGATRRAPIACVLGTMGLGLAAQSLPKSGANRPMRLGSSRRPSRSPATGGWESDVGSRWTANEPATPADVSVERAMGL